MLYFVPYHWALKSNSEQKSVLMRSLVLLTLSSYGLLSFKLKYPWLFSKMKTSLELSSKFSCGLTSTQHTNTIMIFHTLQKTRFLRHRCPVRSLSTPGATVTIRSWLWRPVWSHTPGSNRPSKALGTLGTSSHPLTSRCPGHQLQERMECLISYR